MGETETTTGEARSGLSIRRILVALDASASSREALNTAIGLAGRLHSEVTGLFVEDIGLFHLTELPFAREIRFPEATAHQLGLEDVQRRLRARAAVLRRELEQLAEEHHVASTFRVVRGPVAAELLSAALEADVLALGRLGHSVARRARLGSTARAAIARAASAVLLVKPDVESGPIVVLYDGTDAGRRALETAADLIGDASDLRVLVWGPDEETAFDRRQLAARLLERAGDLVQYQHLSGDDPQRVLELVNRQHGSLLVVGLADSYLPADIVQVLLDEAEQHILLIR